MFSTKSIISLGGSLVKFEIVIETIKFTIIATVPNPSGDIPNHQSEESPPPNHPNLNFVM